MTALDWRDQAACAGMDPDEVEVVFFTHPNSDGADAKAVCRRCPVAAECLTFALETGQDFGVWGATTERERASLARRRAGSKLTKHPTAHPRCGTYSGVSRHRKSGEWLCDPCMGARREYEKQNRARKRALDEELTA